MKKSKYSYFVVPLVCLGIFIPIYWNYVSTFDAREAARQEAIDKHKQELLDQQNALRRKAVDDAVAAQKERAAKKAEAEAREAKRQEALQAAIQTRNKANAEAEQLRDKASRLQDSIKSVQDDIAKIRSDEIIQREEADGFQKYVDQAEANVKSLSQVLQRIADADAAAEAARQAAAKKNS